MHQKSRNQPKPNKISATGSQIKPIVISMFQPLKKLHCLNLQRKLLECDCGSVDQQAVLKCQGDTALTLLQLGQSHQALTMFDFEMCIPESIKSSVEYIQYLLSKAETLLMSNQVLL